MISTQHGRYFRVSGMFALTILFSLNSVGAFAQADSSSNEDQTQPQPAVSPDSTQNPASPAQSTLYTPPICGPLHFTECLKDIGHDQLGLWSSPAHLKPKDALWLAPFAAITVIALRTDADNSQDIGFNQKTLRVSSSVSDLGQGYTTVGLGAAFWSIGALTHRNHLAETGRLGLEAVADAFLVDEALKLATNRMRPNQSLTVGEQGESWSHGVAGMTNSSFPSGHAITTWALARVITSEYPDWRVQLATYAVASAVSISRVTGQNHFPSDVIVGSTLGYLIGGYVVHHHSSGALGFLASATPIADPASRTYGIGLRLQPAELGHRIVNLLGQRDVGPTSTTGTLLVSPANGAGY